MEEKKWLNLASNILKSELKRRNISYDKLVELLKKEGINETVPSIVNKLVRGTFKFSFFLQCASVIGVKNLHLDNISSNQFSE